ncbi:MAG: autotransporter-associated beta strand repeat-containing protein [Prosthecobacter sp.]|uniref:autotransporter-associated beta strand repeat-containing protein n=1 Tax=Prosthecobacter sp. TaxID=1965333 RepID=UPI0025F70011|nr:autotransporter-associated beta strand repeat-containing protein [Prosthecobacter sp.]MCF7784488.1 autotransporter-associated beta strand repeat-containing protein [Prosthecobacter sp.]
MHTTNLRCLRGAQTIVGSLFTALALAATAHADVLVWDTNIVTGGAQDGAGTWTAGLANWFNQTQTLQNQNWLNGSDAVIGAGSGAAGAVALSGPVTVGSLTFNTATSGTYTLGGSGTLTLGGGSIVANANASISTILAGTSGLAKTGSGTLSLNGSSANIYTGTTNISAGTLALSKSSGVAAITGDIMISNGGHLQMSTNEQIADTANVTMSDSGSVFNGIGVNSGQGGVTETIASLMVTGGVVNSGTSAIGFTVTGAVSFTGGAGNSIYVGNSGSTFAANSLTLINMTSTSGLSSNSFTIFGNSASIQSSFTVGSGGLTLNGSILNLRQGSLTPNPALGSRLVLNGNVTTTGSTSSQIRLDTSGGTQGEAALYLSGTAGSVTRTFDIASGADLDISVSITNGASAAAGILKTGAGMLTYSGTLANTFTGDTTINAGTLRLNKTAGVTAVVGNIIVNTGGTLQLNASNQIADTAGITLNGGAISGLFTDETIAFFTQNSGGISGSNTGHYTITGALTLAGGSQFVINSSAIPASWNVGSAILTGADILIGGNNGAANPRTSLTIGAGGLLMAGRTITMNVGTAGVILYLNGDFTGTGTNTITSDATTSVQPLLEIGAASRTFNVLNGTTTLGVIVSGAGGSLVKTGAGLLQVTAADTYSGTTTSSGGTFSVTGTLGALTSTTALIVNHGGILQDGSSTAANNNSVANRINTAATLTLGDTIGGGTFTLMSAATGSHTQDLASLTIAGGANTVNVTAAASTTATLTFTGAGPYVRTGGTVNFVQNPAVGGSIVFTNAPTGAGNVTGGLLVGATLNGTDLIAAQSGVLTAFSGWISTGTDTWTTGAAMDVTGSNPVAYSAADIAALRFNTAGPFTVTLAGSHTINSDVILMTTNAGSGASLITGGTVRGTAGGELTVSQYNTGGTLQIASIIADNTSATGFGKNGGGLLILSGANTYTGITRVSEGVLRAADGTGLPTGSALLLNGGVFESSSATINRALGTTAGAVRLTGSTAGFSAAGTAVTVNLGGSGATVQWGGANFDPSTLILNASTATAALNFANGIDLNGANRSIRVDANTATLSGVISNSVTGSPAGLSKSGGGTLTLTQVNTFDGGVTVTGGTLGIGNDQALGSAVLTVSGGSLVADGAAHAISNNVVLSGTTTISGVNTLALSGVVSSTGTLSKTSTSILELSGNNTYTGTTSVSGGILRVLSNTALGATSGGTVVTGASHVELADGVVVTGETITVSSTSGTTGTGSPTVNRGGLQAGVNATAEWAGDVILGVDLARIGVQEGGTLTISGNITDGANSFTLRLSGELTGTGGVILSGTGNAWDGQTEIVRGTIYLGADNTLPTTAILDIHFINSNNNEYAGLDMNGFNQTIGSLRNDGVTGANAELKNTSRKLSTLTINETGAANYTGVITGNLAVVKIGAGTTTLSQTNSFTGGITVNEGVLQVANSNALASGDLTVNGGALAGGKLDLNNTSTTVNALNGAAGTVSGIIANESTTSAVRTLTVGVNHASSTYAGQIVDNSGGAALGTVALAKIGTGTLTLTGTSSYTGDTTISNGILVADYSTGVPLSASSTIKMNGGTLVIANATTATIGAITQVQSAGFTTGVLRIENGATITTSAFAAEGYTPFLLDVTGGGTLVASSLTNAAVINGILMGTNSNRATLYVQDDAGLGFATQNGSNEIVRYIAATALTVSNTSSTTNFLLSGDVTRTASLSFNTIQLETSGGNVTLNMGASNITVGTYGRGILATGTHDATITASTGAVTGGSIYFTNYSTGALALDISLAAQTVIIAGTGLTTYSQTANPADLYVTGGVFRMQGASRDYNTNVLRIYGGGVFEIGADLNAAADGDFTRAVGTAAGQVALVGNGGFSAYGAGRVVALGGTAAPTALTWGASNFLSGPGGDNNYSLMFGSVYSTNTVEFQNAINLGSRDRIIDVADGTDSTNVDARLTGQLSGTGALVKEGTGTLEFTAVNTYSGSTQVNNGALLISATGTTGTGAVTVANGATLMGSGVVQGSSFKLENNATLQAGNGTATGDLGTLTFQSSGQAVFDVQSGSQVILGITTATNQGTIDPYFGGNAIGSAGYNDYVDAFGGLGTGQHDLLTFDGAAGTTLTFSGNVVVLPDNFTAQAGEVFNLLDWTALVTTDFSGFNVGTNFRTGAGDDLSQLDLPELTGGLVWDISRFTTSGVIVVVPEPGRAMLLLFGTLLACFRRRR